MLQLHRQRYYFNCAIMCDSFFGVTLFIHILYTHLFEIGIWLPSHKSILSCQQQPLQWFYQEKTANQHTSNFMALAVATVNIKRLLIKSVHFNSFYFRWCNKLREIFGKMQDTQQNVGIQICLIRCSLIYPLIQAFEFIWHVIKYEIYTRIESSLFTLREKKNFICNSISL